MTWRKVIVTVNKSFRFLPVERIRRQMRKRSKIKVITLDRSSLLLPWAEFTLEKCSCVRRRENGAPFLIPCKASFAHSATARWVMRGISSGNVKHSKMSKQIIRQKLVLTQSITTLLMIFQLLDYLLYGLVISKG